jgi:hypothetical protein
MSALAPETAKAAQSVHNWTRFAALMTGTLGAVMLAGTLFLAGSLGSKFPAQRGLIAGIGTVYATVALAMLCFSFLLVRYGQKLELAAKQRDLGPLVDAVPYETGAWAIVAGYVAVWLVMLLLSLSPAARPYRPGGDQVGGMPMTQPLDGAPDEEFVTKVNLACGAFAAVGLGLMIMALRPVQPTR